MQTASKTMGSKAIGQTAAIGRFIAKVIEDQGGYAGEPLVAFQDTKGRTFGDIRLSTAKDPIAVDLYESAMWRLNLLNCNAGDYCLTPGELSQLREWANALA